MKTSIEIVEGDFMLYVDGEHEETYNSYSEAEEVAHEILKSNNDYFCGDCNQYFIKADIKFTADDARFTCPFGDTYIVSGNVNYTPVCPDCDYDLEETR